MLLHLTETETVEPLVIEPDRLVVEVRYGDAHRRPPAHFHPHHDERFTVLSGRIGARVERQTRVYEAGESFDAPRGAVHAMWPQDGPAAATWECRPGDRALAWFQALDEVHRRGLRGPARALALASLVGEYDDVFRLAVGPQRPLHLLTRAAATLTRGGERLR